MRIFLSLISYIIIFNKLWGYVYEKQAIKVKDHPLDYFHMHKDDNLRYIGYARAPDMRRGSDFIDDFNHRSGLQTS